MVGRTACAVRWGRALHLLAILSRVKKKSITKWRNRLNELSKYYWGEIATGSAIHALRIFKITNQIPTVVN
jgi:hypothetical protein